MQGAAVAEDAEHRPQNAHKGVDDRVDKAGAGVGERRKVLRPPADLIQMSVDLGKLFAGLFFLVEEDDRLLPPEHLFDVRRQLALHLDLAAEALESALGDERRHEQRQRRQHHDHERHDVVDDEHDHEGSEDGHHPREQLRHPLQQAVGDDVDVVDHAGDDVALGVGVDIADARRRQRSEGVFAQVAHQAVTEGVDAVAEKFLRYEGRQNAGGEPRRHGVDRFKIYIPRADHGVDGLAVQHRAHEDEGDVQQAENSGADDVAAVRPDIVQQAAGDAALEFSLFIHCRFPPPALLTASRRSLYTAGRRRTALGACPAPPPCRLPSHR